MIPGLVKADHIGYVVPDLDAAVAFFVEVAGARLLFELGPYDAEHPEVSPGWMQAQLRIPDEATLRAALLAMTPGLGLELYEIRVPGEDTPHVAPHMLGAPHLAFHVRDLDAAREYLATVDGVTVHGEIQAPDTGHLAGMRWLHFETPWGLVLEVDEWPRAPYGDDDEET